MLINNSKFFLFIYIKYFFIKVEITVSADWNRQARIAEPNGFARTAAAGLRAEESG